MGEDKKRLGNGVAFGARGRRRRELECREKEEAGEKNWGEKCNSRSGAKRQTNQQAESRVGKGGVMVCVW